MKKFYFLFCLSNCIFCKEDDYDTVLQKAESCYNKKNYEEAIDYYKDALQETDDVDKIIEIKIKIADCYFEDKDYLSSTECYKIILGQFYNFDKKEYVLYKLCMSIYKDSPKSHEISLTNVENLLKYTKYYKNNFSNGEYLNEILDIEKEATKLITLNDISNIKFYFDNKLYFSAIFCCDLLLKKYKENEILAEIYLYKIKSQYELSKKSSRFIKKNNFLRYDFFKNLRQNLILIQECKNNEKIYNFNKKVFDDLFENCYHLLIKLL